MCQREKIWWQIRKTYNHSIISSFCSLLFLWRLFNFLGCCYWGKIWTKRGNYSVKIVHRKHLQVGIFGCFYQARWLLNFDTISLRNSCIENTFWRLRPQPFFVGWDTVVVHKLAAHFLLGIIHIVCMQAGGGGVQP